MPDRMDINFIDAVSILLRLLLLIAFGAVILHMFIGMYDTVLGAVRAPASTESAIYNFIDIIVEDSLLAVVIFEIYESIIQFFRGEGDTILYIINAAITLKMDYFKTGGNIDSMISEIKNRMSDQV